MKSFRQPTREERQAYIAGYGAAVSDASRFGLDHANKILRDMTRRGT